MGDCDASGVSYLVGFAVNVDVDTEWLAGFGLFKFDLEGPVPLADLLGHMQKSLKPQAYFVSITHYFDHAVINTLLLEAIIRFIRTHFMRCFPNALQIHRAGTVEKCYTAIKTLYLYVRCLITFFMMW